VGVEESSLDSLEMSTLFAAAESSETWHRYKEREVDYGTQNRCNPNINKHTQTI
jgi:hypothetical protein